MDGCKRVHDSSARWPLGATRDINSWSKTNFSVFFDHSIQKPLSPVNRHKWNDVLNPPRQLARGLCFSGSTKENQAINSFELLIGLAVVAVILYDVFETVVVPRRTESKWRLAPPILFLLWPLWQRIGLRITPTWRREDFLGTFAPFAIMLILMIWVLALIFGFGLVFHALQDDLKPPPRDFVAAFYAAGTALLTIGYGDIVPQSMLARGIALLAGAAGLAVVALVISLAFNLYGSFSRREVLVLLLDPRAGVPPSGVTLLETYGEKQIVGQLGSLFNQYEAWTAELLDSHLAYPVLPFFRSSHESQSWVSALGALLDAATLMVTAIEPAADANEAERASRAAAEMMYETGCHALIDLTQSRLLPSSKAKLAVGPGIERTEFVAACERLRSAGFAATCSDAAWQAFAEHRGVYATRLNVIARYLAAPPTQWIGDRSVLNYHRQPHLH